MSDDELVLDQELQRLTDDGFGGVNAGPPLAAAQVAADPGSKHKYVI
jgi:hypothetical protein